MALAKRIGAATWGSVLEQREQATEYMAEKVQHGEY
jgi:hypothetical protein